MSRPIVQAAVATTYYERARDYCSRCEIKLHHPYPEELSGVSFSAVGTTATVRSFTILDAVFDADTGLLFQDRQIIPETFYFVPNEQRLTANRSGMVRQDETEDVIIGYNNAHRDYQHWLTQCVPAIDWAVRRERTRPVRLLLPSLARWQEDFLAILGYSHIPRVTTQPGTLYHLPQVEYSEFLNGTTSFDVCLSIRATAGRILERLTPAHYPFSIIYVPCTNPHYGIVRNEAEVIALLRRHGAYVIHRNLSVDARINMFRNARVVVGALGEGLTDILFCKPGTLLWEWMPRHHQNASFNRLAQTAEVDYWGDVFESDPGEGMPRSWAASVDTIVQRLSEISKCRASPPTAITITATPISVEPSADRWLDRLILAFEGAEDKREFGLLQQQAGSSPLWLPRFAGISLDRLITALQSKLEGLGSIETIRVQLTGETGREFVVHETSLGMRHHMFIREGDLDAEGLCRREARRLGFLRQKMLEDLASGEKFWVWHE